MSANVVDITTADNPDPQATARATISVVGHSRSLELPIQINADSKKIHAWGEFTLLQSEFGIEPYSVLGGALRVKDEIEVVFSLVARRSGG